MKIKRERKISYHMNSYLVCCKVASFISYFILLVVFSISSVKAETLFQDRDAECQRHEGDAAFIQHVLTTPSSTSQERAAFVVGVSTYANLTNIPNAVRDGRAIAKLFQALGFNTYYVQNGTKDEIEACFERFLSEAKAADLRAVYLAGHGVQRSDQNYFLAYDTDGSGDTLNGFVAMGMMIDDLVSLNSDKGNSVPPPTLILLDACRENALADTDNSNSDSFRAGFAAIDPKSVSGQSKPNLYLAYSTSPNAVAADGTGDNSPYATALLQHLHSPGFQLERAMGVVAQSVGEMSGWKQSPWTRSSLAAPVFLNGRIDDEGARTISENHARKSNELLSRGLRKQAMLAALKGLPSGQGEVMHENFVSARSALINAYQSNSVQLPLTENSTAAFSPDGSRVATVGMTAAQDRDPLRLWDSDSGKLISVLLPPASIYVNSLLEGPLFSPDGRIVAGAHNSGEVYLWRTTDGTLLHKLPGYKKGGPDQRHQVEIAFSPDSRFLASAEFNDDKINIWRTSDGTLELSIKMSEIIRPNPMKKELGKKLLFDNTGQFLILWSSIMDFSSVVKNLSKVRLPSINHSIFLYDIHNQKVVSEFVHTNNNNMFVSNTVSIHKDKSIIAALFNDGALFLWDWKKNKNIFEKNIGEPDVDFSLIFDPSGKYLLLFRDHDKLVRAFDMSGNAIPSESIGLNLVFGRVHSRDWEDIAWIPLNRQSNIWRPNLPTSEILENTIKEFSEKEKQKILMDRIVFYRLH